MHKKLKDVDIRIFATFCERKICEFHTKCIIGQFFENIIREKGFLGEFHYLNNDRAIFPTKSHSNLSQMSQNVEYNVLYVPQRGEMKNDFWLWLSIFSLGRISENAKKTV